MGDVHDLLWPPGPRSSLQRWPECGLGRACRGGVFLRRARAGSAGRGGLASAGTFRGHRRALLPVGAPASLGLEVWPSGAFMQLFSLVLTLEGASSEQPGWRG